MDKNTTLSCDIASTGFIGSALLNEALSRRHKVTVIAVGQFEGFRPPDDFLAQLKLGLAHSAFARQEWKKAESRYDDIVKALPGTDAAAEASPISPCAPG